MLFGGDKQNVMFLFTLVIVLATLKNGVGADVETHLQIDTFRNKGESISSKMMQIRELLKSLILDWNLGESDFKGAVARTFGRIRMMRKIMLPLAFIGGFLTAIILFIKTTGVINMLLLIKVLLLQMALVLGKIVWAAKELLIKKHQHGGSYYPMPVYVPIAQQESSHSHHGSLFDHRRGDALSNSFYNPQPDYNHQASNQPINYRQYFDQPQVNSKPQRDFGQPQSGSSIGISPQQQIQFNQPFTRLRSHDSERFETLDNRILYEPEAQSVVRQPQNAASSLSPHEMTKILSDALARLSPQVPTNSWNKRSRRK